MTRSAVAAQPRDLSRGARRALGVVRLVFGTSALVAPQLLVRRIEGPGASSPAAVYAFRMFGIRTVLLGRELLLGEPGPGLRRALAQAPVIHGADTVTATLLTASGQVPRRTGLSPVAVSLANTVLAVLAGPGGRT